MSPVVAKAGDIATTELDTAEQQPGRHTPGRLQAATEKIAYHCFAFTM